MAILRFWNLLYIVNSATFEVSQLVNYENSLIRCFGRKPDESFVACTLKVEYQVWMYLAGVGDEYGEYA